jgi:DNA-damage-inducible protein J
MKESVVRARIEPDLKADAAEVLAACGLELSDAIRLFLRKVVDHGGLPFAVRSPVEVRIVSPKRLRAMKRVGQAHDRAIPQSNQLRDDRMFLIPPEQIRGAKLQWPSVDLRD